MNPRRRRIRRLARHRRGAEERMRDLELAVIATFNSDMARRLRSEARHNPVTRDQFFEHGFMLKGGDVFDRFRRLVRGDS